jgi:hypothetical protein
LNGAAYGWKWRGEPMKAESSANAEDPRNLIQIMLAKGVSPAGFVSSFMEIYDRNEKFF